MRSACLLSLPAGAQQSALVGEWFLTLDERRAVHTGTLTIESKDGSLVAFVDGGPATFKHVDGTIELEFDTRDGGGQLLSYALSGRVDGDELSGVLTPPLNAPQGTLARRAAHRAATRTAAVRRTSRASGRARRRAWLA